MFNLLRKMMPMYIIFSIFLPLVVTASVTDCKPLPVKIFPAWGYFYPSSGLGDTTVWAILKNDKSYELQKVQVQLGKEQNPIIDGPDDTTGVIVLSPDMDKTILLFTGVENLTPGNISFLDINERLVHDFVNPPTEPRSVNFEFEGRTYKIWVEVKQSEGWKQMSIYIAHEDTKQLLCSYQKASDAIAELNWVADIDRDNKPDLMLTASDHYTLREARLFLSSAAEEGNLLREVGCFWASAD